MRAIIGITIVIVLLACEPAFARLYAPKNKGQAQASSLMSKPQTAQTATPEATVKTPGRAVRYEYEKKYDLNKDGYLDAAEITKMKK
ncbi:MAG: hypothetical protein PHS37_06930 [Candidatus Omnitrophica bacterium]|nr:hypothetical protein [Candidatus Omnitrophota bacterium]